MKLKNLLIALLILNGSLLSAQETPVKFRLAVNGGLGYRIAKIADNVSRQNKEYLKKLKSGSSIDIEATYMIESAWGLGLQYNRFKSKGTTEIESTNDFGELITLPAGDNIAINYIGLEYLTKNTTADGRHNLIASLSIGYLGFINSANIARIPIILKANTIGYGIGMGYEYRISDNIGIGAKLGVVGGSVSKFDMTIDGITETISSQDLQGIERESLTRIDVMGGIRFYL